MRLDTFGNRSNRWIEWIAWLAFTIAILAPGASAFADASTPASRRGGCGRMPATWYLDEMVAALKYLQPPPKTQVVRVLAWHVQEDDRPLRVEQVLLWVKAEKSWILADLFRHPLGGAKAAWYISSITDVAQNGSHVYDAAPTHAQLDLFLKESWWKFEPSPGFKLLDSEVCRDAWTGAFGEPPWHAYRK
jgi:hypothetical protein